jgi:hypothetical protein
MRTAMRAFVVAIVSAAAVLPLAAQTPSPVQKLPRPEPVFAHRALYNELMRKLDVHSVGMSVTKTTAAVQLEGWKKTDLTTASIEPIARQALAILLERYPRARTADSLRVLFSDYTPHVVTLTWTAADFRTNPTRFSVQRSKPHVYPSAEASR